MDFIEANAVVAPIRAKAMPWTSKEEATFGCAQSDEARALIPTMPSRSFMRGATTQFDACQSFAARFAMEKWPRHASPAGAISGLPIAGGFRGGVTALDWSGDFVAIAPFSPRKGSSLDAPTGAKRKPPKNARCDQAVFHGGCATFVGKELCKSSLHDRSLPVRFNDHSSITPRERARLVTGKNSA